MSDPRPLAELHAHAVEWHRRGMSSPEEITEMVHRRLHGGAIPANPTYADFFTHA
jgi:hypothetical protein